MTVSLFVGCGKISDETQSSFASTNSTSAVDTAAAKVTSDISSSIKENKSVTSLTFIKYPSPPKSKTTTEASTIKEIIKYIDGGKSIPIKNDGTKGWNILINLSDGTQISVLGNTLKVNDSFYKVSDEYTDGLLKIYNNMNVEEKSYPTK